MKKHAHCDATTKASTAQLRLEAENGTINELECKHLNSKRMTRRLLALTLLLCATMGSTYAQDVAAAPDNETPGEGEMERPVNYREHRFAIGGGYSYRTARTGEGVNRDYVNGLRSGWHLNVEATCFLTEKVGVGGKFALYKASNRMDNVSYQGWVGTMSDDITIAFIGPSVLFRFKHGERGNAFMLGLAVGYMSYTDNARSVRSAYEYEITGGTLGTSMDFGYDIALSKKLALGFQLSGLSGVLKEVFVGEEKYVLPKDEQEGLGRIDLTVGLRFNL